PMEQWHIKSTSKAAEGLYVYDTVQRLNDSRFGGGEVADIRRYIKLGPLGRCFASPKRHLLLIDEVDKADLEFPNDLLRELDEMRFTIPETGDEVIAKERPIVIITSNNEKELPDAFLRRCVFHFIDFPDVPLMREIVAVHHPHLDAKLLDQALVKFYWLREQSGLRKKPSTSELIDWISALLRAGVTQQQVEAHIPFLGALLKNEQDTRAMEGFEKRGAALPKAWRDLGPKYQQ
ncbi:MAG: MoxR family ATPase, partial [Candidatus Methylomirabilis sp.]|nr:MoxR family ATPase [Deltaproteobacteria bacterium]